jgi:hypothetical protein
LPLQPFSGQFHGMAMYWFMFGLFAFAAFLFNVPAPAPASAGAAGTASLQRPSLAPLFAGIFLTVVIGLRYRVGGDWATYQEIFANTSRLPLLDAIAPGRIEPGYSFVNWLGAQFGAGVWFVNLVCGALFTAGLLRICKEQPNPWLALVVATPFLVIVVGMGFTRQAAAIGALMLGIADLVERRSFIRFIALVALGALFHRTVLVFVPVLLFAGAQNRFLAALLAIATAILGYLLVLHGGASPYEAGYINTKYDAAGAQVRVLMNVVAAVTLLLARNRFYASREEKLVWKSFAVLALISGAALPFVHSSVIVDRMAMYLIPLQLFVFSRVPIALAPEHKWSNGLRFAVVLYSAAVLFVWLNYAVNAGSWIPYQSYIHGPV